MTRNERNARKHLIGLVDHRLEERPTSERPAILADYLSHEAIVYLLDAVNLYEDSRPLTPSPDEEDIRDDLRDAVAIKAKTVVYPPYPWCPDCHRTREACTCSIDGDTDPEVNRGEFHCPDCGEPIAHLDQAHRFECGGPVPRQDRDTDPTPTPNASGAAGWSFTVSSLDATVEVDTEPGPTPAPWTPAGTVAYLDAYGCLVWVEDGALIGCALEDFESLAVNNAYDLSAPEDQAFLDAVNRALGTSYRFSQFPGR